ncbi:MAG TPA: TlpA family protein disulfide reductase [Gammaproteobacteria bacterium]|nr:TlpA family protein disulfide reductase [Gammaproteobacteria bacterium]
MKGLMGGETTPFPDFRAVRLCCLLLLQLLLAGCSQTPPPDRLVEGGAFPDLQLPRFDGGRVALSGYRGRLVVLNVWATWCAPCRAELPSLDRLSRRLDPSRFAVIGLSVDSERDIAVEFLRQHQVRLVSYIDADQRIARDILGIRVYPVTFIIGPRGRLLRRVVGERRWDRPQVMAALRRAVAGDGSALQSL